MVPKDWNSIPLGKISSVVTSGSRDWAKYYSTFGSKFIRMTNLNRNGIDLLLNDLRYVSINTESNDGKRTSLQYGDILISITAELGKIGWVPNDFGEAYINQHTAMVRIDPANAESKFIAYQLSSHRLNKIINSLNDAGAKAGLNLPTIKSIPVLLPPLPEQKKIAQILSTWDKAITTTEILLANSEQQKKALMQQLLTGKRRFSNSKEEWKRIKLKQCIRLLGGNAFKSERFVSFGVPIIRISNIKKDFSVDIENCVYYSEDKIYDKFKVFNGDILIAMSGATTGKVGRYYGNSFCYLNQRVGKFEINPQIINPDFLFQLLKLPYVQNEIVIDAVGGAQPNISNRDIEKIKIHLPSLDEQQKIASVLSCIDYTITTLQKK
ncbi:EcoKI restriction-modification system protein HsdS [Legionella pneumophila]|nr:restriction endonuclease subunit S [Legionella pneumophila]AMV12893.1 EcoKI restriction-modification system protein HsdS [Legionella pneumophila]